MKELKGAILSQIHRRSHEGGPGSPGPLNQNATSDTNLTKKPCFFIFSFFYHLCVQQYTRATVISNKQFCLKSCYLRPLSKLFMDVMQ